MGLHHGPSSPDQATEADHGQSLSRGYRTVYAVHRTTVPTLLGTPNLSDSATHSAAVPAIWETCPHLGASIPDGWHHTDRRSTSLFVGSSARLKTSSGPHLHRSPLRGWHVSSPGEPLRSSRSFHTRNRQTSSACNAERPNFVARHLVLPRESISGTATGTDPAAVFLPNGTGVQFHTPSGYASSFGMPACLLQHGDVGLVARHGALRKSSYLFPISGATSCRVKRSGERSDAGFRLSAA